MKDLLTHLTTIVFAIIAALFVFFAHMPWYVGIVIVAAVLAPSSVPAIANALKGAPNAAALFAIVALYWMVTLTTACGLFQNVDPKEVKDDTHVALTLLQEACVLANAAFAKPTIQQVCNIADPLAQLIDEKVQSAKAAGAALPTRTYPVVCEQADGGAITCTKPYVFTADGGASP